MSNRATLTMVGMLAVLVLQGGSCTQLEIKRAYAPPKAREVLNAVIARGLQVKSLRGQTRMSHSSGQGKVKGTVRFMGQRGGKLRFDMVSPFDTPLATLVTDGQRFALVDAQQNRHFHGPATPCNIARLIRVQMRADDILTVLGGSTPVIDFKQLALAWDPRSGEEVLTLTGEHAVQTIRLDGTDRRWDMRSSEVRDRASGKLALGLQASGFRKDSKSGLRVPRTMQVSQPSIKAELAVQFKKLEINLTLPAVAFVPPAAGALPSQRVDCSTNLAPAKKQ